VNEKQKEISVASEMPVWERCSVCCRIAEDVSFDYLGPDSNDIDGERWDYSCGPDEGCSVETQTAPPSPKNSPASRKGE
jgi:hypothetical protein